MSRSGSYSLSRISRTGTMISPGIKDRIINYINEINELIKEKITLDSANIESKRLNDIISKLESAMQRLNIKFINLYHLQSIVSLLKTNKGLSSKRSSLSLRRLTNKPHNFMYDIEQLTDNTPLEKKEHLTETLQKYLNEHDITNNIHLVFTDYTKFDLRSAKKSINSRHKINSLQSPPSGFHTRRSNQSHKKTITLQPFEKSENLNIWSARIARESSTNNNLMPTHKPSAPSHTRNTRNTRNTRKSNNRFSSVMKETLEIQSIQAKISKMQKEIMRKKQLLRKSQSASDKHTAEQKRRLKTKLKGEISKLEDMVAELRSELDKLSTSIHSRK